MMPPLVVSSVPLPVVCSSRFLYAPTEPSVSAALIEIAPEACTSRKSSLTVVEALTVMPPVPLALPIWIVSKPVLKTWFVPLNNDAARFSVPPEPPTAMGAFGASG